MKDQHKAVWARRSFLTGAAGAGLLGLGGCATAAKPLAAMTPALPFFDRLPSLAPIRVHADRIVKVTVCLRPFRAAGPRFDTEQVYDKLVVHNYGHGGSGWSLSWGSAQVALGKAAAPGRRDIAVIGCGALGLTTALVAQKAGYAVTIYAKDLLPEARSSRATGTWSPDSRVAKADAVGAEFPALWEALTRQSFRTFQTFLGLAGDPVEWSDRYNLLDMSPDDYRAKHKAEDVMHFAQYPDRVRDLTPRPQLLPAGSHPFPARYVQRNTSMQFNIAAYGRMLMTDFYQAGGKIEVREFQEPSQLAALKQKVVINCTGYGAKALWKDDSVIPVRGQIAWLIPQDEVRYGLFYKNVTLLSRRDGILLQQTGETEAWGFGDANEQPDRAEAEAALGVYRTLYASMATMGEPRIPLAVG